MGQQKIVKRLSVAPNLVITTYLTISLTWIGITPNIFKWYELV